jgi:hypothetical protein
MKPASTATRIIANCDLERPNSPEHGHIACFFSQARDGLCVQYLIAKQSIIEQVWPTWGLRGLVSQCQPASLPAAVGSLKKIAEKELDLAGRARSPGLVTGPTE